MALGKKLREARLARGLMPSEVAGATRMKVQIVEGLEREDFTGIAAPIYGKGFIRLYADYIGLDAQPLIDEYMARIGRAPRPRPLTPPPKPAAAPPPGVPVNKAAAPRPPPPAEPEPDLFRRVDAPSSMASAPAARPPEPEMEPEWEPEPVLDMECERAPEPEPEPAKAPTPARSDDRPPKKEKPSRRPIRIRMPTIDFSRANAVTRGLAGRLKASWEETRRDVRTWTGEWLEAMRAGVEALRKTRFSEAPARYASVLVGILIVLLFILSGVSRCAGWPPEESLTDDDSNEELNLVMDPPTPYLD